MKDIGYIFCYPDSTDDSVVVYIDEHANECITPDTFNPPEWALLENRGCKSCPLSPESHRYCPVAKNIAYYFEKLSPRSSHTNVSVTVVTAQRSYLSQTTVQRALSSLLGLIISTSNCPKTTFLKPMGMYHLPFSSPIETLVRSASFQLLAEYLNDDADGHDYSMDALAKHYKELRDVNKGLASLLSNNNSHDAPVNALILLDLLASEIPMEISDSLQSIKSIFKLHN